MAKPYLFNLTILALFNNLSTVISFLEIGLLNPNNTLPFLRNNQHFSFLFQLNFLL